MNVINFSVLTKQARLLFVVRLSILLLYCLTFVIISFECCFMEAIYHFSFFFFFFCNSRLHFILLVEATTSFYHTPHYCTTANCYYLLSTSFLSIARPHPSMNPCAVIYCSTTRALHCCYSESTSVLTYRTGHRAD